MKEYDKPEFSKKLNALVKLYGKKDMEQEQFDLYWNILSKNMTLDTFNNAVTQLLTRDEKKSFPTPGRIISYAREHQINETYCHVCKSKHHSSTGILSCISSRTLCFQCGRQFDWCKCSKPLFESLHEWFCFRRNIISYYGLSETNNYGIIYQSTDKAKEICDDLVILEIGKNMVFHPLPKNQHKTFKELVNQVSGKIPSIVKVEWEEA